MNFSQIFAAIFDHSLEKLWCFKIKYLTLMQFIIKILSKKSILLQNLILNIYHSARKSVCSRSSSFVLQTKYLGVSKVQRIFQNITVKVAQVFASKDMVKKICNVHFNKSFSLDFRYCKILCLQNKWTWTR